MQPYATRPRAVLHIGDPEGDRTSLEKYCVEIIENFITDKRKESQL